MKKYFSLLVFVFLFAGKAAAMSAGDLPQAYYVHTSSSVVKALVGVHHDFGEVFSAELSGFELGMMKKMGVKIEKVQIREITKRPVCGDNVCQGNEPSSCPEDCSVEPTPIPDPDPSDRVCTPDNQITWGMEMINGGNGGEGVKVAVLDTGVKQDHIDLVDNIVGCETVVTHSVPDSRNCSDGHGHGTHTAGTVAASGGSDGLGIYGVASEADLMIIKVCTKRGYCYGDDVARGILYATDNGANIISMSIGGDSPDSQEKAAIDYAVSRGVLVIAAAGNDGPSDGSIDYPGAFANVLAVGAIDVNQAVPTWSSRGINDNDNNVSEEGEVAFASPGVSIESTSKSGCYEYMSGTSMATPHVAGLAAKIWQENPDSTFTYLSSLVSDVWHAGEDTATGLGLPVAQ